MGYGIFTPSACSECGRSMLYENYIDADDGQGERLICIDCLQYVQVKGLISKERLYETDYYQSMVTNCYTSCTNPHVDCPRCDMADFFARGQVSGSFDMAIRFERLEEDSSSDRLASTDSEG